MKKALLFLLIFSLIFSSACISINIGSSSPSPKDVPVSNADPETPGQAAKSYSAKLLQLGEDTDRIVSLKVTTFTEGGVSEYDLSDRKEEVANMLSNVKLQLPCDLEASDDDVFYTFTMDDGSERTFHFNGGNYRVEGDEAVLGEATYYVKDYVKPVLEPLE